MVRSLFGGVLIKHTLISRPRVAACISLVSFGAFAFPMKDGSASMLASRTVVRSRVKDSRKKTKVDRTPRAAGQERSGRRSDAATLPARDGLAVFSAGAKGRARVAVISASDD